MSRLIMLPCAAFLRVYEPLSAFGRTERARWEAYAASADRPRRADALEAEREEALRRIIALPPIVAPARESDHAAVRAVGRRDDVHMPVADEAPVMAGPRQAAGHGTATAC